MRILLAAVALCAAALPALAADDPALLAADRTLVQAAARQDAPAVLAVLDGAATWTDADGVTSTGAQVGRAVPRPSLGDETGAQVRRYDYGRVAVIQVDRERLHALRVWVKRPSGWRLLVYQEVRSLAAPPTVTPGTGKECVNPCRSVPYQPKSDAERGVIAAYQALETSAHAADASTWGTHVADEFILVSSNSNSTFDKPTRLASVGRSSFGGVSPTSLLAAEMFEFGDVVVMRSQHQPDRGDRLQIARVWVRRGGVWQSTLSYQTGIRPR